MQGGLQQRSTGEPARNGAPEGRIMRVEDHIALEPHGNEIDREVLSGLLGGMPRRDRLRFRDLCVTDLGRCGDAIRDAVGRRDGDGVRRQLHVLSSLALTVGARALADDVASLRAAIDAGRWDGLDATLEAMERRLRDAQRFVEDEAGGDAA